MPLYLPPAAPSSSAATEAGPILTSAGYSSWGGANVPNESNVLNLDELWFLRFPIGRACTLDRIGLEITGNIATSVVRLGIYDDVAGKPTNRLLDAGTIDASSGGFVAITISHAVTPGVIWLCAVPQVAGGIKWRVSDNGDIGGALDPSGTSISQYARASYRASSISGALPNPITAIPTTTGNSVRPRICVRTT